MNFDDDIDPAHRQDPSGHNISVRPQGGATSIHFGPNGWQDGAPSMAEPAGQKGGMSIRMGGTQTWNAGSNESGSGMKASWNAGLDKVDPAVAGVAATHSTLYGTAGGGRVTIPGIGETVAENAVRWGYCRWEGGRLVDIGTPQGQAERTDEQAKPPEQKPAEDPGATIFPANEDKALQAAADPLQQASFDSARAGAIAAIVHRDGDLTQVAYRLAEAESSSGNPMEPAQANELIQDFVAYYERAAERAVAPMLGNDPARIAAFRDFIANDKSRFHEALTQLMYYRDGSKFVEAAAQYKRANPGDMSALHKAGFETSIGPRGETMVRPKAGGSWVNLADM